MRAAWCRVSRSWTTALIFGFFLLAGTTVRTSARPPQEEWNAPDAAKKVKNPLPTSAASIAAGRTVYHNNCERCHDETGNGDGPDAELYDPGPANFTDGQLMQPMTDGELFYKITEGRRPMPSFKKSLSEEQRWQVVNYIRTFTKPAKK